MGVLVALLFGVMAFSACKSSPSPDPKRTLVAKGREIFFNETFDGNGRTCGYQVSNSWGCRRRTGQSMKLVANLTTVTSRLLPPPNIATGPI